MKIAIIGAGNIGSLLGALLTDSGQDVTLVELRQDIVDAIRKDGVRIDMSNGETIQTAVKITDDLETVGIADLVVLAVKSNATRDAIAGAKGIIGEHTWVLSVQNGAGNVEEHRGGARGRFSRHRRGLLLRGDSPGDSIG